MGELPELESKPWTRQDGMQFPARDYNNELPNGKIFVNGTAISYGL